MRRSLIAVGLAGCGFAVQDGVAIDDAPHDAGPLLDAYEPDAQLVDAFSFDVNVNLCFGGSGAFQICLPSMPPATLQLSGTIDTASCAGGFVLAPGGTAPNLCVMAGVDVTASGFVRVVGARPLAIVAMDDLTIGGGATLDASSVAGGTRGAGSNLGMCQAGTAPGGDAGGGGGGAGGSFQTRGGVGGTGMGGSGGVSGAAVTASAVRGGCRGQAGGGTTPGSGGDSGGSIYLVAGGRLQIDGRINVTGAGGRGATGSKSGGGGGGSGGMITLHGTPIVVGINARLWANGGGGGGGGSSNSAGTNGGQAADPSTGGAGGAGDGDGGGGANQVRDGAPGTSGGKGGGGGGGGAGVIENLTGGSISSGTFSPPAS